MSPRKVATLRLTSPDDVEIQFNDRVRHVSRSEVLAKIDGVGDACWRWSGSTNKHGRAVLCFNTFKVYVSRIIVTLYHGEFDPELSVCHHCDNPPCVNPAHLYAGTAAQNVADMWARDRAVMPEPATGLDNPNASVAPGAIQDAIATYLRGGVSQKEMARSVGVSQTTFGRWVRAEQRRDAGQASFRQGKGRTALARGGLEPCGTRAAYSRHHAEGTPVCGACAEANRAYMRAYKAARRRERAA